MWGLTAYVVYGSALLAISVFILLVFCRIMRSFHLAKIATREMLRRATTDDGERRSNRGWASSE